MREILLIAQFAAVFILTGDTLYTCMQRNSRVQLQMVVLNVATIIMLLGYTVEMTAGDLETAMAGCAFAYLGKPYALLASLLFFADFCGHPISNRLTVGLAVFAAVFPIIICTNEYHHLYYSTVVFNSNALFSPLQLGHGPFYFVYMAAVVFTFLACLMLTVDELHRCKTKESRHQLVLLFVMLGATIAGYLVFLTGCTEGYDTTMTGAVIGTVALTIVFFKYRIFDYLTLAKEQALDRADNGILVVDARGNTVYVNDVLSTLMKNGFSKEELLQVQEGVSTVQRGTSVYEATRKIVMNKGRVFGQTVEISDITERFNYSTRLEQEVENRTKEIWHIQRTLASSFAGIVEARDTSTGTHIRQMAKYVEILSRALMSGANPPALLTEEYVQCLVDVAPLHDIGKITIPDAILRKPAKLTAEEFEVIKTHTVQGARILRECMDGVESPEYVALAETVARYHHEKWNGKGYPEGLAGEDIPLAARIVAVADVYDAIRSERCYKAPMDRAEAKKVIMEGCGEHFDPAVVDAFMRSIREMEEV